MSPRHSSGEVTRPAGGRPPLLMPSPGLRNGAARVFRGATQWAPVSASSSSPTSPRMAHSAATTWPSSRPSGSSKSSHGPTGCGHSTSLKATRGGGRGPGPLDPEEVDGPPVQWFAATDGLAAVRALAGHLRAHPKDLSNSDDILAELSEIESELADAERAGVRFRFAVVP